MRRIAPEKEGGIAFRTVWRNLNAMGIRIGCGSWGDDEYVGLLFPKSLPTGERLTGYACWFDHVEINSSYYRTPRADATAKWVKQTPKSFLFDIKLHRAFSRNPAKVAAERLGHADPTLFTNLYSHVTPTMQQDAAERIGVLLFGPVEDPSEE